MTWINCSDVNPPQGKERGEKEEKKEAAREKKLGRGKRGVLETRGRDSEQKAGVGGLTWGWEGGGLALCSHFLSWTLGK